MSLPIDLTRDAIVDVIHIAHYLAADEDLALAERFVAATEDGYNQLADFPGMGALRDYGNPIYAGMRKWPVPGFPNYLIFYRVVVGQLKIQRVLHGAQDLDALFAPSNFVPDES